MSSPNVKFNTNFSSILKPGNYFELNTTSGIRGLVGATDKILVLGQMTSSGSAEMVSNYNFTAPQSIFSDSDAALYFGQGSIAHLTARAALLAAGKSNTKIDLSVIGIEDANGATAAEGTIEFDDASESGTVDVWIGDAHVQISNAADDTSDDIADAIHDALDEISDILPVTYGVTGATGATGAKLEITAKNKGTCGNYIPLSAKNSSGMTFIVTAMTGGATDPTIGPAATGGTPDTSKALGYVYGAGYTVIVNTIIGATGPSASTQEGHVKDFVDEVSGPIEQHGCIQVIGNTDLCNSAADFKTRCGTSLNHWRTTGAYIGYATDNLAKSEYFKIAGAYAADLVRYEQQSIPYDDDVLGYLAPPAVGDRLSRAAQESMLGSGVTPLYVVPGDSVAVVRAVTTYTKNNQSQTDRTLIDINTPRTLDRVRTELKSRFDRVFTGANKVATANKPKEVVSQTKDVLGLLEDAEIVKNVKDYEGQIIAEYDTTDPTQINLYVPAPIVPGLHKICGEIVMII